MSRSTHILETIESHIEVIEAARELVGPIEKAIRIISLSLQSGGCLFWAGNGGSMADAIHMSAELVGRFTRERQALSSIALGANPSILSAVSNDYGYETALARELQGLAKNGDVLIAISTSGKSKNILAAVKSAKELGVHVIALTGKNGADLGALADALINVNSIETARIQECHLLIEHIICDSIEEESASWQRNST
jgi:D-sedoheptulose 7-phosphate isomerase